MRGQILKIPKTVTDGRERGHDRGARVAENLADESLLAALIECLFGLGDAYSCDLRYRALWRMFRWQGSRATDQEGCSTTGIATDRDGRIANPGAVR